MKVGAQSIPEPDLKPAELIARAEALRPLLRAEQDEAEQRGRYSEEVHEEFLKAGFYKILIPRCFGGFEFDVPTYMKTMLEISRGDPGTGWMLTFASSHSLVAAAFYSEEGQREMFGTDGDFTAPHRVAGATETRRVDGGYVISGRWDYCSGIPYATWFMGNTNVPSEDPDGPPQAMVLMIPRRDLTVLDDWGGGVLLGMQSSGSNSVVVEDVFVPDHLAVPYDWYELPNPELGTPGAALHANPMYLGRIGGFYHAELAAIVVGAAQAAIDEYEEIITTKKTMTPPSMLRYQHYDYQRYHGRALAMTDAAEGIVTRVGELYMEHCERWAETGEPFDAKKDARLWGMAHQAGALACSAVDSLFFTASSSAARRGSKLQRYYRDVAMYRGHVASQEQDWAARFSRLYLGADDPYGR